MVGQFDPSKPDLNDGEMAIYSANGQVIYMKADATIHQGTKGANEPVVLGNVMKACIKDIIEDFTNSSLIGYDAFGLPVILNGALAANLTQHKEKYVTDASTNIVGQKNFVERGS